MNWFGGIHKLGCGSIYIVLKTWKTARFPSARRKTRLHRIQPPATDIADGSYRRHTRGVTVSSFGAIRLVSGAVDGTHDL